MATINFHDGGGVQNAGACWRWGPLGIFDLTDMVIRLQGGDPY